MTYCYSLTYSMVMEKKVAALLETGFGGRVVHWHEKELASQASGRIYKRIFLTGQNIPETVVLMLSQGATGELGRKSQTTRSAFLEVQEFLGTEVGLPAIFTASADGNLVLLEDLGDATLERCVKSEPGRTSILYGAAVQALVRMQVLAQSQRDRACICWNRRFDQQLLFDELMHWHDYGLCLYLGQQPSAAETSALEEAYRAIATALAQSPPEFVHRDFQSRNLMVQGDRIRIIDFQDALMGSAAYDLVALLRDSYVELEETTLQSLTEQYMTARTAQGLPLPSDFRRLFWLQTLQRKLKDAGRFEYIRAVRKNPDFLVHIPASLRYVDAALVALGADKEWAGIAALIRHHISAGVLR